MNFIKKQKFSRHISLMGVSGTLFAILLFTGSVLFTTHTLKKNADISSGNMKQAELVSSINSSMAHLTMWQNTYRYGDTSEQFTAIQSIEELSMKIKEESAELSRLSVLDSSYVNKLNISLEQLLRASKQITTADREYKTTVQIDSLVIDYRSVFRIAEFHLSTVQDLTLRNASERSAKIQMELISFLSIELLGVLLIGVLIIIIIAGKKQVEKNLAATESMLTDIFEFMPSALIVLTGDGKVIRLNRTALSLCSENEFLSGTQLIDLFPAFKSLMPEITEALVSDTALKTEVATTKPNKKFSVTLFPMTNKSHSGAVLRFDDITEQAELAEQLRHTQKMNAIGQLAGGIAHDFNNVLGGILNATELIRQGCDPDEQDQLLELITNASTRAADLTRKLLTFSKKDIHKIEPVSINQILQSMDAILQHSLDPRITTVLCLDAGDKHVVADAANIQNMFLNLGINAGHAMPNGGTIIFSTSHVTLSEEQCSKTQFHLFPGEYIAIEVVDTGSGIDPDIIEHIFDPFFTTKREGTGIGLAAAYGTVQQCGGEISVSSIVGEGTTFRVLLKCVKLMEAPAPIEIETKHSESELDQNQSKTILVIDDELIIRKSVSLILKRLGYNVLLGENGRDGVELYRQHREEISLILLDMMMPVMNGDAALKEIRDIDAEVPVIICTGFAHYDNLQSLDTLSVQGIMTKPYSVDNLSSAIQSQLAKR